MAENPSIEKLQKKLEKEPNPLIFLQLAEEYRKESLYEDALKVCHDGLRRHPNYWSIRVAVGRIYHEMGDLDKSRDELEKVVKAVPDNLLANKLLGDIYREQNRPADALNRYKIVQMITPGDQEVAANVQKLEGLSGTIPPPPKPAARETPAPPATESSATAELPAFLEKTAPGVKIAAEEPQPQPEPESPPTTMLDANALEQLMNQVSETGSEGVSELPLPPQMREFLATDIDSYELEPAAEERAPTVDRTQPMEEPIVPVDPAVEEAEEFTTQTLAELYVQQGLIDKAVRVYQKLLLDDPANSQLIQRLKELSPAEPLLSSTAVREEKPRTITTPRPKEAPAVQIRNIELMSDDRKRKITTLESWLSTIRRERS
jgi:tetratricopeptide (TPR) repeat protein